MPFPRKITPQQTTALLLLALTGALIAFLIPAVRYFRTLTGAMAVSKKPLPPLGNPHCCGRKLVL